MPRRAQKWVVHERKDGTWDLSRGGRFMYTGLSSRNLALSRLKNHFKDGETIVMEEPDGYRTNVTHLLKRSRIR